MLGGTGSSLSKKVWELTKTLERKHFDGPSRWLQRYRSAYRDFPFLFDNIKFKSPHFKVLKPFLTGGLMFFHFRALKCYDFGIEGTHKERNSQTFVTENHEPDF